MTNSYPCAGNRCKFKVGLRLENTVFAESVSGERFNPDIMLNAII